MYYQLTTRPIDAILAAGNALFKAASAEVRNQREPNPYPEGQVLFARLRLREIEADAELSVFQRDAELEYFMQHYGWNILRQQADWFAARAQKDLADMEFVSRQAYPLALAQCYLEFRQLPVNTAA